MKKTWGLWALGLLLLSAEAGAETYKCRMPDGKISYMGQLPMTKGAKCEPMFVKKQSVTTLEAPPAAAQPNGAGAPPPPNQTAGQPPMPGQPPAQLKQAPPAPANAAGVAAPQPAQKSPEDMDLEAKRKKQDAADALKKADQEKENKLAQQKVKDENCQKARANLQTYQIGGRITKINEKGEKVYLDDNEINQKLDAARQDVAKWCEG